MSLNNILSFGSDKKLEQEQLDLNNLIYNYNRIIEAFNFILISRKNLIKTLSVERFEAERNFTLLATLITTVKVINRNSKEEKADKIYEAVNYESLDGFYSSEKVDSERIAFEAFEGFVSFSNASFERITNTMVENGGLSKKELKGELLGLGASAIISGLEYVSKVNEEISKKREKIRAIRAKIQERIDNVFSSYREVYKDSERAKELISVLNKNNEVFLSIYLKVLNQYFEDCDYSKLKRGTLQDLVRDKDFLSNLNKLAIICEDYSKVRHTTITRE